MCYIIVDTSRLQGSFGLHFAAMGVFMRKAVLFLLSLLFVLCFTSCNDLLKIPDVTEPLAGSSEVVTVPAAKAKVIVLSGQSNAAGISQISQLDAADAAKYGAGFENVLIRVTNALSGNNSDSFVKVTTGWGDSTGKDAFGPEVGLAEQLAESYPGETIYIIKYAWSGAPLEGGFLSGGFCWDPLCAAIDQGLSLLKEQGLDPEVVAFCWMQGESDACAQGSAKRYERNQKSFVNSLREKYGNFFFIDAGISTVWKFYTCVNNAKRDADCALERCVFINTNYQGLQTASFDIAHYDAQSMIRLGHLFGEQIAAHITTESVL